MLRALFSGVAGLKAHQTKMDVIGNNIANVNTYGYKASRTTFQDVFYQTLTGSSGAAEDNGGTNASQIGYGSMVASIDVLHTRAGYASTGRAMDAYINGEGYFVVQDGAGNESYSRVGNFKFDEAGNLVDSNGNFVCGYPIQRTSSGNIVYQVKSASNATATAGDMTVDFGATDIFNGYTMVVQQGASSGAEIDTDSKKITVTLSGASADAVTTATIEGLLQNATVAGADQTKRDAVDGVKGGITVASANTGLTVGDVLTSTPAAGKNATAQIGDISGNKYMTIDFGQNAVFNGYTIKTQYTGAGFPAASIDTNSKVITITLNASDLGASIPAASITSALQAANVTGSGQAAVDAVKGDISVSFTGSPVVYDLVNNVSATNAGVIAGPLTVDFGPTSALNGYRLAIEKNIGGSNPVTANAAVDSTSKTITITVHAQNDTDSVTDAEILSALKSATGGDSGIQAVLSGLTAGNITLTGAQTADSIVTAAAAITYGTSNLTGSASITAGNTPGTATGVTVKDGSASGMTNTPALDTSVAPTRIKKPGTLSDSNSDGQYDAEDPNDVIELNDIAIGSDGIISGTDQNGSIIFVGQIALANISNPEAMTMEGNSYYKASNNSGEISYEYPGEGTTGSLVASGLEMSNVDLANEFSEMITTQRGFQANSRIITVGDTMLEELINLKR